MNTRTLPAFFLTTCFFVSCSKSETSVPGPPPDKFTISGVHDVTIDTSGKARLDLVVADVSGDTGQFVSLWISAPSRGLSGDITRRSGVTDFTSSIAFGYDGVYDTLAPGRYPIKIVGASASDTVSYDCNLTVPPFNGFTLSGAFMRTATMSHTANTITIMSQVYGGMLVGESPAAWPTVDGTYTYMVGGPAGSGLNFRYRAKNSSYDTYWTHGQGGADTVVLIISGGKMALKSGVLHAKSNVPPAIISVNAHEY